MTSLGSLSKEFPLDLIDKTILAIRDGMTINELRGFAAKRTHSAIPAILKKRFLLVEQGDTIIYDRFLSLVSAEGLHNPRVRKVMYFLWAFRDHRLRQFISEVVAGPNGKWRASELTKKSNAKFFQKFFEPNTSAKVRSNIEYFLVESGIFSNSKNTIHLELEDGWITEGVSVASQHEPDFEKRRAMIGSPVEYLIANGLNPIASATVAELQALSITTLIESDPIEDRGISVNITTKKLPSGSAWNRPKPTALEQHKATTTLDIVALERAHAAHWMLESIMSESVRAKGFTPKQNKHIDMYFVAENEMILAEMKSCHRRNLHTQVRRGVAQLLEYRYLYKDTFKEEPILVLVIETAPSIKQEWLAAYLESIGILLSWKDANRRKLVSKSSIPKPLQGIILPIS